MGIFSSIGRFLFGGPATSEQKGTQNSTSTQTPYGPAMAHIDDYLADTAAMYDQGAPQFSNTEMQGQQMLQRTVGATPQMDSAVRNNQNVMDGQYLTPDTNPYLADIAKRVSGGAMASVNATFGGRGRTGGGMHAVLAGEGVGNALSDLYGRTYEAERGRQQQSIQMAPSLEAGRYLAPQALLSSGQSISARPFDIAAQRGGILANIARLGGTTTSSGTTTGSSVGRAESAGLIPGMITNAANSWSNKLFG